MNGTNQQGLVRFAKRAISPHVDPIQSFTELTPTVTPLGPGTVRIGWKAAWDRDNERLTYEVLRGATTATVDGEHVVPDRHDWWNRPPLGFVDATAPPGSSQTYRIRVTDPFGNALVGPAGHGDHPGRRTAAASSYAASGAGRQPDWQWRLGEASGTTAYDRAGSNDHDAEQREQRNISGALVNEADTATNFPGTSSTAPVQGVSPYWQSGPQTFSLEAWLNTATTQRRQDHRLRYAQHRPQRLRTATTATLYMNNCGSIYFGVRPDMGTRVTINSPLSYRDNQWHHVVGTLGSDGMKLYVDGSLVASNASVTKAQVYRGYWRSAATGSRRGRRHRPGSDHREPRRDRGVSDRTLRRPRPGALHRQRTGGTSRTIRRPRRSPTRRDLNTASFTGAGTDDRRSASRRIRGLR